MIVLGGHLYFYELLLSVVSLFNMYLISCIYGGTSVGLRGAVYGRHRRVCYIVPFLIALMIEDI